ncbi:hypothetical protein H310_13989 [Aphanomyces invadans]|uniref:Apple domain-containing protein n=1 Tax=Aphanomyces invadans TaxID=157072 RepID=A0A024TCZ9_9STRA|nr:hypothetical protein H310_13989 [Aphanomyces invadans]ETV91446.1 hypothetical protein H310_13989 [Aphanomyces invadans]|eukprot:XP_008879898.1 hypothetical protein H310_13989 [Aphanomyces invadans]
MRTLVIAPLYAIGFILAIALQGVVGTGTVLEPNMDYWGNDIRSTKQQVPMNCRSECASNPLCILFVWRQGTCFLKHKRGPARVAPGAVAGVVYPQCSAIEDNTDYKGNDIATTQRASPRDCCADCTANGQCVVVVWFQGTCYLKNLIGAKSTKTGAVAVFPHRSSIQRPTLQFLNRCKHAIQLYKVDQLVCTLPPNGGRCNQSLATGEHPMFRHTRSEEATLVEMTLTTDRLWFDLSVVPPNCRDGKSHDECIRNNGGRRGFNVPVSVVPVKYNNNPAKGKCNDIVCHADVCPQAYVYPSDDTKMRDCPPDESLFVTYCP